jgi:hypothetical protein
LRSSIVLGPPARRVNSTMASSLLKNARRGNWRRLRSEGMQFAPARSLERSGLRFGEPRLSLSVF